MLKLRNQDSQKSDIRGQEENYWPGINSKKKTSSHSSLNFTQQPPDGLKGEIKISKTHRSVKTQGLDKLDTSSRSILEFLKVLMKISMDLSGS